jgi:alpha-L-fucosidase
MKINAFKIMVVAICISMNCKAQTKLTYEPTWASVNRHNPGGTAPEWIKDGKFGVYYHLGAFSVPAFRSEGFGEWYGKWMNTPGNPTVEYHTKVYGDPAEWPYHFFINGAKDKAGNFVKFMPRLKRDGGKFDPDAWAQLFANMGARFAGPIAEHHDGYSMWRSKCNEWNAYDKIGIDIVGEMITAIRKHDMKIVITFHHAYPIMWKWWPEDNPEYAPSKCKAIGDKSLQKLYGKLPMEEELNLWEEKLKEVEDAYQPDFIYHDVGLRDMPEQNRLNHLAYYYNQASEWGKDVMVSFKNEELNRDCAVLDFEGGATDDISPFFWVCDQNLGPDTWSYVEGMTYYPAKTVLHSLISIVSKNGALLLNFSPKADGTIPQEQQDIAQLIGRWLKSFGECIYGTRPWATYGEGPSHTVDGIQECTARDIRFTRNKANTVLYAIFCGWPGNETRAPITALRKGNIDLSTLIGVELLGENPRTGISLKWKQLKSGLHIKMPDPKPYTADAYVIRLTFSGQIPSTPVLTLSPGFQWVDAGNGVKTGVKKGTTHDLVRLREGSYTTAQLAAAGIPDNTIETVKVNAGWTITLYDKDNFTGDSVTCKAYVRTLKDKEFKFDKKTSSLKISKEAKAPMLQ